MSCDDKNKLTLLLSGGGFRATLFHLGCICYLRESQKLSEVKEVFSVSGGSILAAHLIKNWSDYALGEKDQFERAVGEIIAFARTGIRESIIRTRILYWMTIVFVVNVVLAVTWLQYNFNSLALFGASLSLLFFVGFFFYFTDSRTNAVNLLVRHYRKLLGNCSLADIAKHDVALNILGTNLTTGDLTCFSSNGILPSVEAGLPYDEQEVLNCSSMHLAECVAASSSFPPLFSPYRFEPKKFNLRKSVLGRTQLISDGGVFDNLGIEACHTLSNYEGEVLVSDAEVRFDWATDQKFRFLIPRAVRSTDILMKRVGSLVSDVANLRTSSRRKMRFARLQDNASADDTLDQKWRAIAHITRQLRTDLDSFSNIEIQCLMWSGYIAAREHFGNEASPLSKIVPGENGIPVPSAEQKWLPFGPTLVIDHDVILEDLADGKFSKPKLLCMRHFYSWVILLLAIVSVFVNPASISLFRNYSAPVSQVIIRSVSQYGQGPDLPQYSVALIPNDVDILRNQEYPKQHRLLIESQEIPGSWFFKQCQKFEVEIDCDQEVHLEYLRAILVSAASGEFRICKTDINDGQLTVNVPATYGSSKLIIHTYIATQKSVDSQTLSDGVVLDVL